MTLIKFEPLREMENIHSNLLRYFEDFPSFNQALRFNFFPKIDISEKEDSIHIDAEIPGVKKEDLKITLQDNILTLEGEKKKEVEEKDQNDFRSERCYGSFKRSFTLPNEVDSDKVEAKYDNGMLKVILKKVEAKKPKEKVIKLN
ncbi:MAG: Hsp20/alpha crystallin family protein [Bacteroidetes bacterium]|nr:Hsp20/alpha crystallin family protein [Bacteroidota bacterium]MBU1678159.1 Hsp20/alpha crystallin family protein [Bacteroidota bacterium]